VREHGKKRFDGAPPNGGVPDHASWTAPTASVRSGTIGGSPSTAEEARCSRSATASARREVAAVSS
jgi:hypothetical protein